MLYQRHNLNWPKLALSLLVCSSASSVALADEYHYNSIFIGDRAAGLAGAYAAVSDDPSGLYYNPAGIVHASNKNISGSMNAIHTTKTVYKNAFGTNSDWVRSSSELLPNFFGVLQDFGDGKAGFSYAVVDSTLENQDQDFDNIGGTINNYAINFNNQDKTIYFGPSYAFSLNNKISLGITIYGHYRQKEQILHEYIDISSGTFEETSSYRSIEEMGIRPVLGVMYSPMERVSIGITLAKTSIFSSVERTQRTTTDVTTEVISTGPPEVTNVTVTSSRTDTQNDKTRTLPLTLSTGVAIFVSNSLLVSGDLVYQEAVQNRISVLNFSLGSEYYVSSKWAIRGGLFSNLANTLELKNSNLSPGSSQPEHIDYFGLAFSVSRFSSNNTLSMGFDWSRGKGNAQLFPTGSSGNPRLQTVKSRVLTIFLSATYSY